MQQGLAAAVLGETFGRWRNMRWLKDFQHQERRMAGVRFKTEKAVSCVSGRSNLHGCHFSLTWAAAGTEAIAFCWWQILGNVEKPVLQVIDLSPTRNLQSENWKRLLVRGKDCVCVTCHNWHTNQLAIRGPKALQEAWHKDKTVRQKWRFVECAFLNFHSQAVDQLC